MDVETQASIAESHLFLTSDMLKKFAPFSISCKADLLAMNFLKLVYLGISYFLLDVEILVDRFFFFLSTF